MQCNSLKLKALPLLDVTVNDSPTCQYYWLYVDVYVLQQCAKKQMHISIL